MIYWSPTFHVIRLLTVIILINLITAEEIKCRNAQGEAVDWFIVYKLPKTRHLSRSSVTHLYLDALNNSWHQSTADVLKINHAVGLTVEQVYKNYQKENFLYIFYNDEDPSGGQTESRGHTKGVIAFTKGTGFWLIHSLPKFPNYAAKGYEWPESGMVYGQTFLCITFKYDELEKIGTQLLYNYPNAYDFNIPDSFSKENPNLTWAIIKSKHIKSEPWKNLIQLTSEKGQKFYSFAKFSKFDADLYSNWLAPYFQDNMLTETWQNGAGSLHSECKDQFKVMNIKAVNLDGSFSFKSSKDHSKWTVSESAAGWTCVGDINRQEHQEKRAGGTICFQIPHVWKNFFTSVVKTEKCNQEYEILSDFEGFID